MQKQIIFEAESLCAILAYFLLSKLLANRMNFLFVDNEGTKFCMMKGMSDNLVVDLLCHFFAETEMGVRSICWISRVNSYSNIVDDPSRGDASLLFQFGFVDVSKDAAACLESLCLTVDEKMGKRAVQSKLNLVKQ